MVEDVRLLAIDGKCSSNGDITGRRSPKKIFRKSHGEWLFDEKGRRYLDFQMCNSAATFGHGIQPYLDAMTRQMAELPSLSSEFIHETRVKLAEALVDATAQRWNVFGRVHFSVGGAQAIDDALKLIGKITGTTRVFAFEGSYHGRTLAASSISGAYRYRAAFGGVALADYIPFPDCVRCPYGQVLQSCRYQCVAQFARLFDGEGAGQNDGSGHPECRAFVAEPILGRGGYIPAPPEYFVRLKHVLDAHGILFVADEVQMGFFRAGRLWSIERYGIVPDIVVFGKAVTNGMYPLSGLWARQPLMSPENWPPGSSHATFAGAPLGTTLGLVTMELCKARDWAAIAENVGAEVERSCSAVMARYSIISRVSRAGAALSLGIYDAQGAPAPGIARDIVETALQGDSVVAGESLGAVLTAGGSHGNMIMFAPSLTMSSDSLNLVEPLLDAIISRVLAGRGVLALGAA